MTTPIVDNEPGSDVYEAQEMTAPTPSKDPLISGLEDCAFYFDMEGAPKDAECCRLGAWLIASHSETIDSLKRDLAARDAELARVKIQLEKVTNERDAAWDDIREMDTWD